MDWFDYREKLKIGINDKQKLDFLVTVVLNQLESIEYDYPNFISYDDYFLFCNTVGIPAQKNDYTGIGVRNFIEVLREHRESANDFISYYIAMVNCISGGREQSIIRNIIIGTLSHSHIPVDIIEDDEGFSYYFPKGVEMFDDALVSEVLNWLNDYPETQKVYSNALRQYSEGVYIRDVADNLRKSLEAFLQEFLGNDKNLKNNKTTICKLLGEKGLNPNIGGFYHDIINKYDTLNNEIAKHHDAVDKNVLEFLLYQTGILIRMIIVVLGQKNLLSES